MVNANLINEEKVLDREKLKPLKGVYVLIVALKENVILEIGALGNIALHKGIYAYVGSAQTNLLKRVERHLRKEKRKFWHIDYLLNSPAAKVTKVLWMTGSKAQECNIANIISKEGEPTNCFGSSDCRCISHLFRIEDQSYLLKTMQELNLSLVI